jgi:hypothetical protein
MEPSGVLVEILNPDGSMARRPELEAFAAEHGLKIGSIEELIRYRLATEHTVERVDAREIETEHGPFQLFTYRDRLSHALHFALLRGQADPATPTLVRVHVQNPLADALHWRRADFGPAVGDVLARIVAEGRGALVLLADTADAQALLSRIRGPQHAEEATAAQGMLSPNGDATAPAARSWPIWAWAGCACSARRVSRSDWPASAWKWSSTSTPRIDPGIDDAGIDSCFPPSRGRPPPRVKMPDRPEERPMTHYEGDLRSPEGARFAIIASRWNPRITDTLVAGARRTFADNGVAEDAVDVIRVPGAWEIPLTAARLAAAGRTRRWWRSAASCAATPATTNRSPTAVPMA